MYLALQACAGVDQTPEGSDSWAGSPRGDGSSRGEGGESDVVGGNASGDRGSAPTHQRAGDHTQLAHFHSRVASAEAPACTSVASVAACSSARRAVLLAMVPKPRESPGVIQLLAQRRARPLPEAARCRLTIKERSQICQDTHMNTVTNSHSKCRN